MSFSSPQTCASGQVPALGVRSTKLPLPSRSQPAESWPKLSPANFEIVTLRSRLKLLPSHAPPLAGFQPGRAKGALPLVQVGQRQRSPRSARTGERPNSRSGRRRRRARRPRGGPMLLARLRSRIYYREFITEHWLNTPGQLLPWPHGWRIRSENTAIRRRRYKTKT